VRGAAPGGEGRLHVWLEPWAHPLRMPILLLASLGAGGGGKGGGGDGNGGSAVVAAAGAAVVRGEAVHMVDCVWWVRGVLVKAAKDCF
jgi:hypothetical protein